LNRVIEAAGIVVSLAIFLSLAHIIVFSFPREKQYVQTDNRMIAYYLLNTQYYNESEFVSWVSRMPSVVKVYQVYPEEREIAVFEKGEYTTYCFRVLWVYENGTYIVVFVEVRG